MKVFGKRLGGRRACRGQAMTEYVMLLMIFAFVAYTVSNLIIQKGFAKDYNFWRGTMALFMSTHDF